MKYDNVILTDCDGVLMNWEYAFTVWMEQRGYTLKTDVSDYDMGLRYDMSPNSIMTLIKLFNQSAAIGFLPPHRDAMYYVDLLHRKHGYVFHMITSLSKDINAQNLRIQNTKKLFGETAFERFLFLDTGADKTEVLANYKDSGCYWIEDIPTNVEIGQKMGLEGIMMEHGHNMDYKFKKGLTPSIVKNWRGVYKTITGA